MTRPSYRLGILPPATCFSSQQKPQHQFPRTPAFLLQILTFCFSHWLKYSSLLAHVQSSKLRYGQLIVRGKVCWLPKEWACCLQHTQLKIKSAAFSVLTWIRAVLSKNNIRKKTLASSFARSWGSKLHAVRTWRTIEGLAAKGNSPGVDSPKQWRWFLWNVGTGATIIAVIGWSGMLWYCIAGVPLVVASMGTAKLCSAQAWQKRRFK